MLPSGLVRARVRQRRIEPSLVDPEKPAIRRAAEEVVALFERATQAHHRLGRVLEDLDAMCEERRDHRLIRGLAHLLKARCRFAEAALGDGGTDLPTLRMDVFRRAAELGPLSLDAPGRLPRATASQVLDEVGTRHGLSADQLREALYADLATERRLEDRDDLSAEALVHRYNVALVQGLLQRATEIRLELATAAAPRLRQLFRWVKFHQLLYRVHHEDGALHVTLDGPMALFRGSTRYGRQLARFFPAVPLQPAPWRLQATVLWTRANHRKQLEITHAHGLVSHLADTGVYRTRAVEQFVARFGTNQAGWSLEEASAPVQLSPSESVFPDFVVRAQAPARRVHLEVLGHWREDALNRRLRALEEAGDRPPIVFAVSRKLAGGKGQDLPDHPQVVPFADVIPTKKVIEALERVAAAAP